MQGVRREGYAEHPAQWAEDALPEGVGGGRAGGGAYPVRHAEARAVHTRRRSAASLLALMAALMVLAVPALWAIGYAAGGAPGARWVWPWAGAGLMTAGIVTGYWLARRSS